MVAFTIIINKYEQKIQFILRSSVLQIEEESLF